MGIDGITLAGVCICIGLSALTAQWLIRSSRTNALTNQAAPAAGPRGRTNRFENLDGLRGLLALFVFIHHASIWYMYVRTGSWESPPSTLLTHFGHSSVAGFFMITGFLFFSKLLRARTRDIDWVRLYVGRILRLVPLYFTVIALLFLVVALMTGEYWTQSPAQSLHALLHWLTFTIWSSPDINSVPGTKLILSGVTWSLAYEWLFYLALPMVALTLGMRLPGWVLVLGIGGLALSLDWRPGLIHLAEFATGFVAALAVRWLPLRRLAGRPSASVLVLACLVLTTLQPPEAQEWTIWATLSLAFILIAGGSTVFGVLSHPSTRALGELTYGIYLLHGLALFVMMRFVLGYQTAATLPAGGYWALVTLTSVVLIVLSHLANRYIEMPSMRLTSRATQWLRDVPGRVVVLRSMAA